MRDLLESKKKNIGALCGFLKSDKNKKYLDYINNSIIDISMYNLSLSEKLYYFFNEIDIPILCDCKDHRKFIGFKNGYRPTCGKKECYVSKRRETCLEKYGVDNPNKLSSVKEKSKKTIINKYNGKHYMLDDNIRKKFKSTMNKNHGVNWAQQSEEIKLKSIKTWKDRDDEYKEDIKDKKIKSYSDKSDGEKRNIINRRMKTIDDRYGQNFNSIIQEKIKITSQNKYGVDHFLKSKNVIEKRINSYKKTIIDKLVNSLPKDYSFIHKKNNENSTDCYLTISHSCGEFEITRQLFHKRINDGEELCLNCNPIQYGYSQSEKEVFEFIKNNYNGNVVENDKSFGVECDIYLPDLKLGIEYNGLYWHSELYKEDNYHLNKTELYESKGIKLIHIFEDEWLYKKDIVKSRLLNLLGKSEKVYARKCEIKEIVDNKEVREFLDKNHIQGFVGSKIKLGLYYNNELVSIMTFGNLRKNLGQNSREGSYELLRFCNELNTSVIGGASRLFKHFIKVYKPDYILSYADRRWSNGNLYEKLDFKFIHNTVPNYYYINKKDCSRINRFNLRKDKLVKEGFDPNSTEKEIMFNRGYYRIYDSGSLKYEYGNYNI